MSDYKRVQTSAEVWAVIRARHQDMRVFSSYSAPDGDRHGDPTKGRMFTSLGFDNGDYPIMEAETTWDLGDDKTRNNLESKYWLCLPNKE